MSQIMGQLRTRGIVLLGCIAHGSWLELKSRVQAGRENPDILFFACGVRSVDEERPIVKNLKNVLGSISLRQSKQNAPLHEVSIVHVPLIPHAIVRLTIKSVVGQSTAKPEAYPSRRRECGGVAGGEGKEGASPPRAGHLPRCRHSHGSTGRGAAHTPFLASRASFSNPSSTVSPGAYFRYHQHQPCLTSS
jgi:hypothetical protein